MYVLTLSSATWVTCASKQNQSPFGSATVPLHPVCSPPAMPVIVIWGPALASQGVFMRLPKRIAGSSDFSCVGPVRSIASTSSALKSTVEGFNASGNQLPELLIALASSDAFRRRTVIAP